MNEEKTAVEMEAEYRKQQEIPQELKEAFNVQAEYETNPEKYVLQTLDDAALVLTVCRMSIIEIENPLPSFYNEVITRLMKVSQLMQAVDEDVAQWNTPIIIDSSLEGN